MGDHMKIVTTVPSLAYCGKYYLIFIVIVLIVTKKVWIKLLMYPHVHIPLYLYC